MEDKENKRDLIWNSIRVTLYWSISESVRDSVYWLVYDSVYDSIYWLISDSVCDSVGRSILRSLKRDIRYGK